MILKQSVNLTHTTVQELPYTMTCTDSSSALILWDNPDIIFQKDESDKDEFDKDELLSVVTVIRDSMVDFLPQRVLLTMQLEKCQL